MIYIRKKSLLKGIVILAALWLTAALFMLVFANQLIFEKDAPLPKFPFHHEKLMVKNQAGLLQDFLYVPHDSANEAIIYFHGTAGRSSTKIERLREFGNLLAPAYQGFGDSEGEPDHLSVYETVHLAMEVVKSKGFTEEQIVIWGTSLGGSAAVYAGTQYPNVKKVVLINTFDSIQDMGSRRYDSTLTVFAGHILNSKMYGPNLLKPQVRQFHVAIDSTVPTEAGLSLFRSIGSKDKKFVVMPGTHTSYDVGFTLQ